MSSIYFSEEHELFRQSFRDFLHKEVVPHLAEWEEARMVPESIFRKFGEMGYFGLMQAEEYGGSALDFFYTIVFNEELSKINSGGFAASIIAHPYLALTYLAAQGNADQRARYLIPGIKGENRGGLAITEPAGGSDVRSMRTKAEDKGDHYLVNGSKTFITNGVSADYLITAVQTNAGISMFIIDTDKEGYSASNLRKLGWHASDTGELFFEDLRVPKANLLGEEGSGFLYIMQHFVLERLILASGAVAASEGAMDAALKYMSERAAFGRPINKFQVLRHRMAQFAAEIECQKQFVYSTAKQFQENKYPVKEASMAKLLATELCDKVTTGCLQMFGGYGYMEEYPMARMFRDARLGTIGGGTSEIMREIIAKIVIDKNQY